MPKNSFVYVLVIAVLLTVWMVCNTLGAASAAPNTNMVPFGTDKVHTIAAYSPGMHISAAEAVCAAQNPALNYAWVQHVDPEFNFCVIDPAKIIPPRAHKKPTSAYRHLQVHPGVVAIKHNSDGIVEGVFLMYFEPEAWIIEKDRLGKFPVVKVKTKSSADVNVDTTYEVRYNRDNDAMLSAFVMEPGIDFDIIEIDDDHKFVSKERVYCIDYSLKGL